MDTLTLQDQDEDLYLMSNVQPAESGLPFLAYISERQGQHDVRVKLAYKAPNWIATVTVRPTVEVVVGQLSGRDLDLVRRWIELNKDIIIAHWEGQMPSSRDVLNALKPLPKV